MGPIEGIHGANCVPSSAVNPTQVGTDFETDVIDRRSTRTGRPTVRTRRAC
jgi:hypothetical protein